MNGGSAANAALLQALAKGAGGAGQVVVCVPFPYLHQARDLLSASRVAWGAQDVSAHRQGAYTGEVSAGMLQDFGCSYVLAGHSERRQYHAESSDLVAQKAEAALGAGLTPIICVGETLAERESERTAEVVRVSGNRAGGTTEGSGRDARHLGGGGGGGGGAGPGARVP